MRLLRKLNQYFDWDELVPLAILVVVVLYGFLAICETIVNHY